MILIDEATDKRLVKTLEGLKQNPGTTRCIHFHFSIIEGAQAPHEPAMRDSIVRLIKRHLPASDTQVYLCDDGDIFILAPQIAGRAARDLIQDIAALLKRNPDGGFAGFYQLQSQIKQIYSILEERQARLQRSSVEQTEKQAADQAKRKRSEILDAALVRDQSQNILKRRQQRDHAELMLIEDDVFSKRLVENVLGKDYKLTALTTAERALTVYASLAPDVLLLDIGLPDVTGHDLLESILAIDPSAYIIMLSGNADKGNVTRALKMGAKGFIAKPFTREKIMENIDRCPTIRH